MANWLTLSKISDWDHLAFLDFQYDWISDEDIEMVLKDVDRLASVDCSRDWQEDRWLSAESSIPDERKHVYRVASLVRAFTDGSVMRNSITLDTFSAPYCKSAISDGHHRIRALQYLGLDCAPFNLGGVISELKKLVRLAGTKCPEHASKYFSPELLSAGPDDIKVSSRAPRRSASAKRSADFSM